MSIKVYYSKYQTAKSNKSYSPSAQKPSQVVDDWMESGFDIKVIPPKKATVADLCLAHDESYVKGVLSGNLENGFGNKSEEVAKSLLHTTGSFLSAAEEAITRGGVAVSPTSGFHHACYSSGGGFCTFNGLMVSAVKLLEKKEVKRVGILDMDFHYGNGTDDIIKKLELKDSIRHFTTGATRRSPSDAETFLESFHLLLKTLFDVKGSSRRVDILFYQAGADAHKDDPLGGWMTTEQLKRRDKIVFEVMKELNIPVVVNLAGGYQVEPDGSIPKVLEIHRNTMEMAQLIYSDKEEEDVA